MWVSLCTTVAASSSRDAQGLNEGNRGRGGRKEEDRRGKEGRKVQQKEKINTGLVEAGNQNTHESQAAAQLGAE